MGIEIVKVRAKITIGATLTVVTPYIQSFNVRKARGTPSTFDASLKIPKNSFTSSNIGGDVVIQAGKNGSLKKIFTGILKKATFSPCWADPGYIFFNISGVDAMSLLQGKKYTRRCRGSLTAWVSIDSVVRAGLRTGKLNYVDDGITFDSGVDYKQMGESANLADDIVKHVAKAPSTGVETNIVVIAEHLPKTEGDSGTAPDDVS